MDTDILSNSIVIGPGTPTRANPFQVLQQAGKSEAPAIGSSARSISFSLSTHMPTLKQIGDRVTETHRAADGQGGIRDVTLTFEQHSDNVVRLTIGSDGRPDTVADVHLANGGIISGFDTTLDGRVDSVALPQVSLGEGHEGRLNLTLNSTLPTSAPSDPVITAFTGTQLSAASVVALQSVDKTESPVTAEPAAPVAQPPAQEPVPEPVQEPAPPAEPDPVPQESEPEPTQEELIRDFLRKLFGGGF